MELFKNDIKDLMSTAEKRAFQQMCNDNGNILVIALDQRNSMRDLLTDNAETHSKIDFTYLGEVKADMVKYLGNYAPAVLLDPLCALPKIIDDKILARDVALVVGMDDSGWNEITGSSLRYSHIIPGINAKVIRKLGGTAAKIMVYIRPDQENNDQHARKLIAHCVSDCEEEAMLLVVEILVYKLPDETQGEFQAKKGSLILDAAILAKEMGAKILKLQYPGSVKSCQAITVALNGTPWALLSAGVDHANFIEELRVSMQNGASGSIMGRSLWKDCLSMDSQERKKRLETLAIPRLREVQALL